MRDEHLRPVQREGVSFFGEIGAGLSHELSNVFNIINELSGLQQDILASAADGGTAGIARVNDLAARIKSQIARGEEINRGLHRLSHSVDSTDVTHDIGDTLALFGALEARAARLAEVTMSVRPPTPAIAHRGDPFALLLALHACMKVALAAAVNERQIDVGAEMGTAGIRVVVKSSDPIPEEAVEIAPSSALVAACAALGATVHLEQGRNGAQLIALEFGAGSVETAAGATDREAEG
jgi:hypothetical protein